MSLKLRTKAERREYLLTSLLDTLGSIYDDAENGSWQGEPVDYDETKLRLKATINFYSLQLQAQKSSEENGIIQRVRNLLRRSQ